MTKALIGCIARADGIEATFQVPLADGHTIETKQAGFSDSLLAQSAALFQLYCQSIPGAESATGVQLYTELADPEGGGLCVDLVLASHEFIRVEAPADALALARDAFKAALTSAANGVTL